MSPPPVTGSNATGASSDVINDVVGETRAQHLISEGQVALSRLALGRRLAPFRLCATNNPPTVAMTPSRATV